MKQPVIICVLVALATCLLQQVSAQKVLLAASDNQLFIIDPASPDCKAEKIDLPCKLDIGSVASIAMLKDTLFFISGNGLYETILGKSSACKQLSPDVGSVTLTVDRRGVLYWVTQDGNLLKYNRHLNIPKVEVVGNTKFRPSGDLAFYNEKLCLAADDGIAEIDTDDPSNSKIVIPVAGGFHGLINIPVGCKGNKMYGVRPKGSAPPEFVEIDMEQKKIGSVICSPGINGLIVLDAASITESGLKPGINVTDIFTNATCPSDRVGSLGGFGIRATSAVANMPITLTFTLLGEVYSGLIQHLSNGFGSPGDTIPLHLESADGCRLDTFAVIPRAEEITVDITLVADSCGKNTGSVSFNVLTGRAPFTFSLDGRPPTIGPDFHSLQAGGHLMNIADANRCMIEMTFIIEAIIPPLPLDSLLIIPDAGCGGGGIRLKYTSPQNVIGVSLDTGPFLSTDHFTGVSPGKHRLRLHTTTCIYDTSINMPSPQGVTEPVVRFINKHSDCSSSGSSVMQVSNIALPFTTSFGGGTFTADTIFNTLAPGVYPVVIKDAKGCTWSFTDTILPSQVIKPVIDTTLKAALCSVPGTIKMVVSGAEMPYRFELNGIRYPSGTEVQGMHPGNHLARVFNKNGCQVDSVNLFISHSNICDTLRAIFVPSAFTPNGDGKNDILYPVRNPAGKVMSFSFRVYNRYGQAVFRTSTPGVGWDGNYKGIQQPTATYIWHFEGMDAGGHKLSYQGTTVLIR